MPKFDVKETIGIYDVTDKKGRLWKALFAEFVGTFFLNFFGCASTIKFVEDEPTDVVRIALAFGFAIFIAVQALGHVSGAHLNPAVTASFLITGKVSIIKALFYVIVQILGCLSGSAMLKVLTPDDPKIQGTLGLTLVSKEMSAVQGFGVELVLGFVLVMVVFGVCDAHRPQISIPAPLAIGLAVGLGHLAAVPLTGASMNPARTLGSAIVANIWTDHWVYVTGPTLGGMIAGLVYHYVFRAAEEDEYSQVQADEQIPPFDYRSRSYHKAEVTGAKIEERVS